ncbi:MAG: family 16 glycosylhydrolase [Pseudomonadota bacterium]
MSVSRFKTALLTSVAAALAACATPGDDRLSATTETPAEASISAPALQTDSFREAFGKAYRSEHWYVSDYRLTTDVQDVTWDPQQVAFDKGALSIRIIPRGTGNGAVSGEVQRLEAVGYGYHEALIKPARGAGLVTAFFAYTDERFGDPHEEISIQFAGRDTTKVVLGYVSNDVRADSATIDLGFDAAEGTHAYAFDRTVDEVKWYVDGELVHTAPVNDLATPTSRMRLIANLWAAEPSQYAWTGAPDFEPGARAVFDCIAYRKTGDQTDLCTTTQSQ